MQQDEKNKRLGGPEVNASDKNADRAGQPPSRAKKYHDHAGNNQGKKGNHGQKPQRIEKFIGVRGNCLN